MSRMAGFVALALLSPPAAGQELSAEQAMARYAELTATKNRCSTDADPDEIVVCARDESAKLRLPLPNERGPRDGSRRATGDVPRPGALAPGVGEGHYVGIDLIGGAQKIVEGVAKIIDPDR